jgi:hypothetical protein
MENVEIEDLKFGKLDKTQKFQFQTKDLTKISRIDTISPPSVFVGSKLKYPFVNVGILSPLNEDRDAWLYDDAKYWAQNNFSIKNVLDLRNNLLNSRFKSRVTDVRTNKKFVEISKEIAISSKQVDVEIELNKCINLNRDKDRVLTPHGMRAGLKDAKITSNVKIDSKVDKIINDEIRASEGLNYLYKNNINEYSLAKILSIGVLGLKKNKKMVPTRWSITATDDSLSREIINSIKEFPIINEHVLFFGEFLGNQYLIMLFPDVWNFELFELYYPGSSWNPSTDFRASTDFEDFNGRKEYAFNCAGGYYATRFPIVEYLKSIKRQASVLVVRLETPSYWAGLGVWVVRESVRKALERGEMKFNSREEFLDSIKKIAKIKFDFSISQVLVKSKILNLIKTQKKLGDFGL